MSQNTSTQFPKYLSQLSNFLLNENKAIQSYSSIFPGDILILKDKNLWRDQNDMDRDVKNEKVIASRNVKRWIAIIEN